MKNERVNYKIALLLFLIILSKYSYANMASPVREGTKSATVFSSKDMDIIKEKLIVTIDKDFSKADFVAEYLISSEIDGKQIPLLFFALNYQGDFKVWVDETEVKLLDIPSEYTGEFDSLFNGFRMHPYLQMKLLIEKLSKFSLKKIPEESTLFQI